MTLIICIIFVILCLVTHGEGRYYVRVNGDLINTDAVNIGDRIFVPLRAVSEALGANVSWDGESSTASVDLQVSSNDSIVPGVIEKVSKSVVGVIGNISEKSKDYSRYSDNIGHGSGVIIKSDGEVLTNAHVIEDLENIIVVLYDGKGYKAEVKNVDTETDLALLKINASNLEIATFAGTQEIIIGKTVIALGTPISFSLRNSASMGIISGVNRSVDSPYRLIQTDAAINPGNSGGPLINLSGHVVGINSNKYIATGIEAMGFSIPIDTVKYVIDQFERFGEVKRPTLGVNFEEDILAKMGLPTNAGLTVASLDSKYSGQMVLPEDVIISINDAKINSIIDYNEAMKSYLPGDKANVKIRRKGVIQNISVFLL